MSQALWEAMGLGDDDVDESEVFLVNTTVQQTVWHAVGLGDNSDDDVAPTVAVSLCTAAVVLSEPTSDARAELASSMSPLHRLPSSADVTPLASSSSPMHSLQSLGDDAQPSPGVTRIPPMSAESLGTNCAGSTIPREPDPPPSPRSSRSGVEVHTTVVARHWWQPHIPNRMLAEVGHSDVIFRFPAEEPQDTTEWVVHCLGVLRSCCVIGSYYWGITENPRRRWDEDHCQTYSTMRVVAVCRTSRETAQIERQLIAHGRAGCYRCNTVGPGGERASAGSPHFVYLCRRQDGLIRGRPGVGGRLRMGTVADDLAFLGAAWR